ncbi:glycoside hydrolase family 55 [Pyrrhoderma noxium]|uniref:Glycoside hydrolase family 55 n=1 Tax=Pyrrhoderma noxium TaxID=2282107 RepID=A0A286UVG1_9AGAM|nr:glycoside hydrolase family 55 [Pyrrhoderma noxium]
MRVASLGSTCSAPVTTGTAGPNDPFWLQNIKHQGLAAFNSDPSGYQVFRNVKDFGAKGDGVTDDTAAINAAMSSGDRCGNANCDSTTTSPAIVYFPPGTYLVSQPIVAWYYTQLIGDARNPPTLLAAANFVGIAVIDADPYIPGGNGNQWYINQNNFYRSVRNFVIDLTRMPVTSSATGLHWQVSQATSLMNIVVNMSTDPSTAHQGIFMENGSGGFMGDLVFNGGKFGIWVGNQQFTVRNITVNNAQSAIFGLWNWGWTFQGVTINNCQVGFDLATGGLDQSDQSVGAEAIIDAVVTNTPIFLRTSQPSNGHLAGSLVLNNIKLNNVPTAVGVSGGDVVLAGGTTTIEHWVQGNVYTGTSATSKFVQANVTPPNKASSLLDSAGRIFGKTHPQYVNYAVDQFVSIRSLGAKGDGKTDDTQAIQDAFSQFSGCKIIFFDHGTYLVTSTITIPAGTQIVGEAWSVIMGGGSAFEDINNPQPVVRVGETNSQGTIEISDMLFTTRGPAAGAIVIEWNVHDPEGQQGAAGMWDSHIRLGGALGTNLDGNACPNSSTTGSNCMAAFLGLHLTPASSAYLEGTWIWLADHSLDPPNNELELYSGRGIYSQSAGPVWMIGTASEHHVLYQYNLVGAKDHYMGLIQTETAYFQPDPAPPAPFTSRSDFNDPTYSSDQQMAWAVRINNSNDIFVFGAGLYSFFQHYNQACLASNNCQTQIFDIDDISTVSVYSLSTIASQFQLTINGQNIADQGANRNGLQSTVTAWTRT